MISKRLSYTCLGLIALALPLILVLPRLSSQESQQKKVPAAETPKGGNGKKKRQGKGKNNRAEKALDLTVTAPFAELNRPEVQEDFPAMCLNTDGQPIIVYIEHKDDADTLKLASLGEDGKKLIVRAPVSGSGVSNIYQPCLTLLPNGRILCVWSQLEADGQWDLMARTIGRKGLAALGEPSRLTGDPGNDIFPDLGTDRHGRGWLTWQRMKNGVNQVLAKNLKDEAEQWSDEVAVTDGTGGGDWEPRLAFGESEEALIVFDSYRNGNFDVFLTRVAPDGTVREAIAVADSDRYEARAEAVPLGTGASIP